MFRRFIEWVKRYYQARGKSEIASILTNFGTGFGVAMFFLVVGHLEHLISPEIEINQVALLAGIIAAISRSILAGALYALMKIFLPKSWQEKLDAIFLRAANKS